MKSENLKSLKQSETAKRSNLAEWRASRLHELDLPSGLHVMVRDVDMTDLLLTGLLPPSVMEKAVEATKLEKDSIELMKLGMELAQKDGPAFKKLLDAIANAALIEPKIGENADDTHITLDELTIEDKTKIMEFIDREVEQIKSFREGQNEPVAAV